MLYLAVHSAQQPETLFKRQYFNSDSVIYVLRRDTYRFIRGDPMSEIGLQKRTKREKRCLVQSGVFHNVPQ